MLVLLFQCNSVRCVTYQAELCAAGLSYRAPGSLCPRPLVDISSKKSNHIFPLQPLAFPGFSLSVKKNKKCPDCVEGEVKVVAFYWLTTVLYGWFICGKLKCKVRFFGLR